MLKKLSKMHLSPEHIQLGLHILFGLFVLCALVQLLFLVFHQSSMLWKMKPADESTPLPAVSVIVCARNEEDNLHQHLPKILNQDYPEFEVIVVNHQSTDDSRYILHAFKQEHPRLRVVEIAKNEHLGLGKKLPLSVGIKGAKHEHLILTDADCEPASNQWLKLMAQGFAKGKELVVGYGPYERTKGLLNRLIRFDTAYSAMNYLGSGRIGMGYMSVGRNFGYTKSIYESVDGFKSHYSVLSGDDDLFFQQVAKRGNHTICIDPDSFCYSEAKDTWESWVLQKERHLSASTHYKVIKKLLLGTYPLTLLILLLSFVTLLSEYPYPWLTLSIFSGVVLLKWILQARCFVRLKEKSLAWAIPLFELVHFIIIPFLLFKSAQTKKRTWR